MLTSAAVISMSYNFPRQNWYASLVQEERVVVTAAPPVNSNVNKNATATEATEKEGESKSIYDVELHPIARMEKVVASSNEKRKTHVLACVHTRPNTQEFLMKLLESDVAGKLYIHICNNNAKRQAELESLASTVVKQQQQQQQHPSGGVANIEIVDMGGNVGGFGRFILARQLMERMPGAADYVIMLDDDQYVRNTTISEVYAAREPTRRCPQTFVINK